MYVKYEIQCVLLRLFVLCDEMFSAKYTPWMSEPNTYRDQAQRKRSKEGTNTWNYSVYCRIFTHANDMTLVRCSRKPIYYRIREIRALPILLPTTEHVTCMSQMFIHGNVDFVYLHLNFVFVWVCSFIVVDFTSEYAIYRDETNTFAIITVTYDLSWIIRQLAPLSFIIFHLNFSD